MSKSFHIVNDYKWKISIFNQSLERHLNVKLSKASSGDAYFTGQRTWTPKARISLRNEDHAGEKQNNESKGCIKISYSSASPVRWERCNNNNCKVYASPVRIKFTVFKFFFCGRWLRFTTLSRLQNSTIKQVHS